MKISIKIILPIVLISAMLILLNGCLGTVPDDSPGYNPGSITGRIMVPVDCTECQTSECIPKSNDGVPSHWIPVGDAIVTVIPHATLTDENGYYTLSDIEPGVYYVITATYGNLVLKDIVEPPGVKAGETYDAGTANCESTALGLIVEALLDMGLDTEDIELALEIIKENPKFDDLVDIICCIIEDCGNVTLVCGVDELIQDLIDDEPGYTPLLDSLTILPDSISLCIGATKSIEPYVTFIAHYTGEPDKIVVASCAYSSKDSGIASISGFSVYGESDGSTTIDVSASYTEGDTTVNVTGVVPVRVIDCSDNCIPELESLSVVLGNTQPMTLCNGATQSINSLHIASIIAHYTCGVDEILALSACTYTSENPSIASIGGSSVTGNAVGSTNIVVSYTDGGKTVAATQKVAVEVIDCTTLESITVSPNPLNLCAAGTGTPNSGTIVTTAHYSDGTFMVVTPSSYSGYDTSIVASVIDGLVTSGSATGSTTVTVYYEGQTATATVNVTDCTDITTYTLTMEVYPTGGGTTTPAVGVYPGYAAGQSVSITAIPTTGWHFIGWTVSAGAAVTDPNSVSTTVTMDANKTVTANFEEDAETYTLTMEVNPTGGGTTTPAVGVYPGYAAGQSVSITAIPTTGWHFIGWTVSAGAAVTDPNSVSTTVTMDANKTVTANFEEDAETYTLTMEVYPTGGGTTTPAVGVYPGYAAGQSVSITAIPTTGWHFIGWTVSAGAAVTDPNSVSTTVTMDANKTVTANFEEDAETYTLTMGVYPTGGGTTTPAVGVYPGYAAGQSVSITAIPTTGWHFIGWTVSAGAAVTDPNSVSTTVTMDANKTVTANFEEDAETYTLTMEVNPTGGGTTTPAVGVYPGYAAGQSVSITAIPTTGWHFIGWTVSAGAAVTDPNSVSTTVTMDANKTVTANFELIPAVTYDLTMQVSPTGSGTTIPSVAGSPYTYPSGTVVNVSATAASGYQFVNWTGGDVADPNSASTTVTMDGDKTVTANFIEDTGTVSGKICQHNGNGYGRAWAYFRNTDTNEIYSAQGAPGSGNYSIILPAGDYVLWANKPSGSQCPTSIGYNTNGGNSVQDPNGWICLTVSSAGMHYYDIWVDNAEGSHPGPCVEPPPNACQ